MKNKSIRFNSSVSLIWNSSSLISMNDDYSGALKPQTQEQPHLSGLGTIPQSENLNLDTSGAQIGLLVRIAASHAGIVTRNHGFYLPSAMKDGTSSFLEDYNKPILIHHGTNKDPIGRVVGADYVDTSGLAKDFINKDSYMSRDYGKLTPSIIDSFVSGRMPYGMQVETVSKFFTDKLLEDDGYDGLGYVSVLANITDPEAIQKILDGRYLTCSVGVNSDKASCSICRQDWVSEGACEHSPGATYDGAKCFLVTGKLWYDELSFVNTPADKYSRVIEYSLNNEAGMFSDSVQNGKIFSVAVGFPQYEGIKEIKDMKTVKTENKDKQVDDQTLEIKDSTDQKTVDEGTDQDSDSSSTTSQDDANTDPTPSVEEMMVAKFVDGSYTKEDVSKLYELQTAEIKIISDGAGSDLNIQDAVLDDKAIKNLPISSFLGKKRVLPIHDCVHIAAVRSMFDKYAQGQDISKFTTILDRKSKRLQCQIENKDQSSENQQTKDHVHTEDNRMRLRTIESLVGILQSQSWHDEPDKLSADEEAKVISMIQGLSSMLGQDSFQKVLEKEDIAVSQLSMDGVLAEVVVLESELGGLRETLDTVQSEYKDVQTDLTAMRTAFTDEVSSHRETKIKILSTIGKYLDESIKDKDVLSLKDNEIEDFLSKMLNDIDSGKFVDSLKGDGMSRKPNGETFSVTDAINEENKDGSDMQLPKPSIQDLKKIESRFWELTLRNKEAGLRYLDTCRKNFNLDILTKDQDR